MEPITVEQAWKILVHKDSYESLEVIVSLHARMERKEWLKFLGETWSGCDNIWSQRKTLKTLLGTKGPIHEMMDDDELEAFEKLPDVITVYRGCGPMNKIGASWSLKREVAEAFPFRPKYMIKYPALVTGEVKKKNIIALKLDREEHEVITFSVKETGFNFILTNPLTNEPVAEYLAFNQR